MTKHIIFDFDGTLADTSPVILGTMTATIRELGLPARSPEECRATIGLRLEDIPATLWPREREKCARYAETYRRIFDEMKTTLRATTYPGVLEGLEALHRAGYGLAVASSRNRQSLAEYLDSFGIRALFSSIVGGNDVAEGKPEPEPVYAVFRDTGWEGADTLVVGDAVFDIEMGNRAGCLTCGVTYGNQSKAQLLAARPTLTVDSFPELIDVLTK